MRIHINKKIEILFLHFTFILIFFSRYIEHGGVWRRIWLLFFIACLIFSKDYRSSFSKKNAIDFFLVFAFAVVILSLMVFGIQKFSKVNARLLLYIVVMTCAISAFSGQSHYIDIYLKSIFPQLNLLWIINMVLLFIQVNGTPLMIKKEWMVRNPYYEDLCCGLFGYNGTHCIELQIFP